ncbi:two-component system activity regulator YycH [Lysinibacillus sp. KU-BSD001]|uniref:YycH family regulatory protein n=1 Tax=Lysinibacillus sp. KU-BSD001 TaxID=3141328 RepID=UPI0036E6F9A3
MKYIEPIKSFILFFLVLMSLMLTFMTWSYKPEYPYTEVPQTDYTLMGDKKSLSDVMKPYRMLFSTEEGFYGTSSTVAIDTIMDHFNGLQAKNFTLLNANLSNEKTNEMIRIQNRMTMFFQIDIPIQAFQEIIPIEDTEFHDATFNRLMIDWNTVEENRQVQIFFVSTSNETVYRVDITITNTEEFKKLFVGQPKNYLPYRELTREHQLSLYTVVDPLEVIQYTYFVNNFSSDLLKEVLFEDTSIVLKTVEGSQEKYTDIMSLLTLDTDTKVMNYVDPAAESIAAIEPYDLVQDTFGFVNEHGGFTGDYRLAAMNLQKHVIEYQLFLQGYPVFSGNVLTRVSTTWGEQRIYRYRRPSYSLDIDITAVKAIKELASGHDIVAHINRHTELDLAKVDDLVIGYYLRQGENSDLYILEPSWFAITGSSWTRLTTEWAGGDEYGLE